MMNSRKSWISSPLLKNIIKNNLFPAKVSLIIFIGAFLLGLLSGISNSVGLLSVFVFGGSAVVLTTIYPCYLQSYLVDKNKASLVAALPLSSRCVWFTNYVAGYLIALVTLIIEGFGVAFFIGVIDSVESFNFFVRFLLMIVLLLFVYYTLAYLVCCMSGNRLGQVIFSLTAYCLPIVIVIAMVFMGAKVVPSISGSINEELFYIFPLAAGMEFIYNSTGFIFIHVLASFGLLGLSYYIYKNRTNEHIGEPLVFNKMLIVLKVILVLIATICGFTLILFVIDMDINYGVQGILALMLIYMLIGLVASILIEIIFKGRHIYRNLLIYLPVLAVAFGINYLVANYGYVNEFVDYEGKITSSLDYNNAGLSNSIRLDNDASKAFIKYLNGHRELIKYTDIQEDNSQFIYFYTSQADGIDVYNNHLGFRYIIDKKIVINFFNGEGRKYFDEIFNETNSLKDKNYLECYYNEDAIYLLNDEIDQFIQFVDNSKITPDNMYQSEILTMYDKLDSGYLVVNNDQIDNYFNDIKFKEREDFVLSCQSIFYDIVDDRKEDYDDLIRNALQAMFKEEHVDYFYYENEDSYTELTEDNYAKKAKYTVVTKEGNVYSYLVKFTFEKNNGEAVLVDVVAGGSKNG